MKLLNMARQLIAIAEDISNRFNNMVDLKGADVYDFDQIWGSTALGFGGIGGSAMTTERTYVIIPKKLNIGIVYFGDRFAYAVHINDRFKEDLDKGLMASVAEQNRYLT